jgi:hypothetical protein
MASSCPSGILGSPVYPAISGTQQSRKEWSRVSVDLPFEDKFPDDRVWFCRLWSALLFQGLELYNFDGVAKNRPLY